ncbi:hypothetical protein NUW54_g7856 [Trametes sanguinea]|uniref:Uncharacterized protein n=1 Tax=Trametes sanguinea TaxID=158606 RepID=A0ACC1PJ76_9APHY|nr:hypothetical protein NUW54_g7856 [Trametes sanguinea]
MARYSHNPLLILAPSSYSSYGRSHALLSSLTHASSGLVYKEDILCPCSSVVRSQTEECVHNCSAPCPVLARGTGILCLAVPVDLLTGTLAGRESSLHVTPVVQASLPSDQLRPAITPVSPLRFISTQFWLFLTLSLSAAPSCGFELWQIGNCWHSCARILCSRVHVLTSISSRFTIAISAYHLPSRLPRIPGGCAPIELSSSTDTRLPDSWRKFRILWKVLDTAAREQIYKSLLTLNHYVCLYPELYRSAPGKAAIYELPAYLEVDGVALA